MARRSNEELLKDGEKPRKKGEGTVFELPGRPGYFRAVRVITDAKGVSRQVSGSGSSPEQAIQRRESNVIKHFTGQPGAQLHLKEIRKAEASVRGLTAQSTFHELMIDWLEWRRYQTSPKNKLGGATRKQYETHIRLHLGPSEMGQTPIGRLTRQHIEHYFFRELPRHTKKIVREGKEEEVPALSISNQRAQQSIVNMTLNYAAKNLELIPSNPASEMERIFHPDNVTANTELNKKRKMAYKLALLLRGHRYEARYLFALLTGARQSEILGATWGGSFLYLLDDYDPGKPARFVIKQQLVRDPDSPDGKLTVVQRTKSRASTRVIPLDPRLVELLLELKQRRDAAAQDPIYWAPEPGLEDLVFCDLPSGKPVTHQRDHKRWKAVLKEFAEQLDGDEISLHGLRHLTASIMVTSGAPIEHVKNMLGHNSAAVTSAIYLHLGPANMVEDVQNFTSQIFRDRIAAEEGREIPPYNDDDFFER
jgi:integrase